MLFQVALCSDLPPSCLLPLSPSLHSRSQGYMRPLKHPEHSPLCDPSLVDEMFYQVPEILEHHEQFLERVVDCVNDWHDRQTVGHLLVESVRPSPQDLIRLLGASWASLNSDPLEDERGQALSSIGHRKVTSLTFLQQSFKTVMPRRLTKVCGNPLLQYINRKNYQLIKNQRIHSHRPKESFPKFGNGLVTCLSSRWKSAAMQHTFVALARCVMEREASLQPGQCSADVEMLSPEASKVSWSLGVQAVCSQGFCFISCSGAE